MLFRSRDARVQALRVVGLGLAALAVPFVFSSVYDLGVATTVAVDLLVVIGLNLLSGFGGQISLGHGALVAIGAYATAILTVDHGWGFWAAAVVGALAASVFGGIMALPALRLSAWYFALVTLAFAQAVSDLLTQMQGLTGGFAGIVGVRGPAVAGGLLTAREMFWLVAAVDIVAFAIVANIVFSRFGRATVAVREGELVASANGASVIRTKLFIFVASAFLAGIAGAFFAAQNRVVTPDDFTASYSVYFLIVVFLGGSGRLWGPVVGTAIFFLLPQLLTSLQSWRLLVFGALLIPLMIFAPDGIAGLLGPVGERLRPRRRRESAPRGAIVAPQVLRQERKVVQLEVRDVTKHFGGVTALASVSLRPAPGRIHGVVGPNGSGKTTLLNVMTGYYKIDAGRILLDGVDVAEWPVARIARAGIGRTFQTPKLLPELNLLENVLLGAYVREGATGVEVCLRVGRAGADRRRLRAEALEVMDFVGIRQYALSPAGTLTHAQQRLAEIARALMSAPKLLMLDEPAAGLSLTELDALGRLLGDIRSSGMTVVVVEHHLDLLSEIASDITVLDRGCVLVSGPPKEVFSDPSVQAAYMGVSTLAARGAGGLAEGEVRQ